MKIEYPIKCLECGNIYNKQITNSHLKKHNMTTADYIKKYGEGSLTSETYRNERSLAMAGENNPNYGNTMSEESKQKISKANRNREGFWKGKSLPESTKQKQSETKKKKFKSGELTAWNKGGSVSEEVKEKISNSVKQYAANNPEELSNRAKKAQQTLTDRYGEDYIKEKQQKMIAAITPEGKQRQKESLIEHNKNKSKKAEADLYEKLEMAGYTVVEYNKTTKYITYRCCNGIEHTNHRMYFDNSRNELTVCKMCIPKNVSAGELELRDYIHSLVGRHISFSDKSTIWPYELDIIVKSKNIAVEYNGLYYHSVEMGKFKNYHRFKSELTREKDIELIHVFEDEWIHKQEIVKSVIRNKLGIIGTKVFARKCIVKEVPTKEARTFIDRYHLYGYKATKVKLGLYYDDELLQVMTFSTGNHSRKQSGWEIDRFATKFDYQVIGGASKLFKHFIKNYNPEEVVSYADLRYGKGNVYEKLGFELVGNTEPSYFYFIGCKEPVRIHRYVLRKTKEENLTGKTEFELRAEQGYYRIYDCGHNKWLWKKK